MLGLGRGTQGLGPGTQGLSAGTRGVSVVARRVFRGDTRSLQLQYTGLVALQPVGS